MSHNLENNLKPFYSCIEDALGSVHAQTRVVPVLMGPTGSGKTGLAVGIAKKYPLTAIAADLRQLMRGMEIGSAQPSAEELAVLPHRLCGILDPSQDITVNDWRKLALEAIGETFDEGRIPLVLGGSGMCVKALISGEKYDAPPAPVLRKALVEWVAADGLVSIVEAISPVITDIVKIDELTNRQRVIRGIERYAFKAPDSDRPDGLPLYVADAWKEQCEIWKNAIRDTDTGTDDSLVPSSYEFRVFALLPDRGLLRKRIEDRARWMFANGLLDEVSALLNAGIPRDARALKGHGYPEAIAVLDGKMTVEEAVGRTTLNTTRYAKRQITWLRHQMENVTWIETRILAV